MEGGQSPLLADALSFDPPTYLPPRRFLDIGAALPVWSMKRGVGVES